MEVEWSTTIETMLTIPCLPPKKNSGFTLIEAMVVVAIVTLLAALAAPSMQEAFDRYRVGSVYDELRSTLVFARSEAIRTRSQVIVARSTGSNCPTVQDWHCGWVVFIDANTDNVQQSSEPSIRVVPALVGGTTVMTDKGGADGRITFDRWGNMRPMGAMRQVIAPRGNSAYPGTRSLCTSSGGRIRWVDGDPGPGGCS